MQLIDKSALVAEIEKRKKEAESNCGGYKSYDEHRCGACIVGFYEEFLEIIDDLEVKEARISTPNIDDILKEEGLDPYSKEAKIFKEIYYTALDRFINTVDVKEENCIWKIARTTVPEGSTN